MKVPESLTGQKIIIEFVQDQTNIRSVSKSRLQPQILRDDFKLNFHDMLERQWTLQQQDAFLPSRSNIFTSKNIKLMQMKQKSGNISKISQFDKQDSSSKNSLKGNKLKSIETVFENPDPIQDLDLFIQSTAFQNCVRFFVLLNLIGLILTDYSFRLDTPNFKHIPVSIYNKVSLNFQLLANCAFSLEILLKMFSRQKFFNDPWKVINLIGCLSWQLQCYFSWITIFLDFVYFDGVTLFQILICLKILLVLRIIQLFQFIRNPFQDFITTIPALGKIFFPLLVFISFYSILGLILFSGANQYKCRATPEPVDKMWPQVTPNLCGSGDFQCQTGYCGNSYKKSLQYNLTERYQYGNQYGLVSYDNIGSSFLTTYHYVFLSNWTAIKYKFSRFITPYVTTLYFFTSALFLFFIMANLNMITICKAYIEKEKTRQKISGNKTDDNKQSDQTASEQSNKNLFRNIPKTKMQIYKIIQYIEILVITLNSVVILIDYEGIQSSLQDVLGTIDFCLTIFSILLAIVKIGLIGKLALENNFNILDWIVLSINLIQIVYCLGVRIDPINSRTDQSIILRSIKFIRIIRLIYFSQSWFSYEKTILKMFGETLKTLRFFFLLLGCLILITAFIGQNLFAFRVRFDPNTRELDIQNGNPYITNYESIYKAIVSVILMLQNQRWTETMYNYYKAVGWVAVIFFTIIVFIVHLMLIRLFIAIFLCYFRRNLQKNNSDNSNQRLQGPTDSMPLQVSNHIKQRGAEEYIQENADEKIKSSIQTQDSPQGQRKAQKQNVSGQKLFWCFRKNSCVFQMLRALYFSEILEKTIMALIAVHCITIIVRAKEDSHEKTFILDSIQKAPLIAYCVQVLIGIMSSGFYFEDKSYLKQSKMNYINFLVAIIITLSEIAIVGDLQSRILRRFAIIKIFTPLARAHKQTQIILKSISAIAQNFIRVFMIYVFLLLIPCVLLLKLENNQLYDCLNFHFFEQNKPTTAQQCMLAGGDWVKDSQSFSNIFSSLVLMYQIVTSESWTYYIQKLDNQRPWDVYFVLTFFIYNTCLLNIFVGMTVQTYLTLKDEAYKLNLLRPSQRMWMLIRNSINQLVPVPAMQQPETDSALRKIAFRVISQQIYENFIDMLAYLNILVYSMRYYRADPAYLADLNLLTMTFTVIFCCDTILKLQLGWDYFHLDSCRIQLGGFIFYVIYGVISLSVNMDHDLSRTLQFFGAMFLILRCKKLIFRYTWCKTLVNSVLDVLPKCIRIGQILALILFFYLAIGMQLFKHTKSTPKIDGYTTGFNNALTSFLTLIKIVSNESWFQQVAAHVRGPTPSDVCFFITSIESANLHPNMGCGSYYAYFFFISFHVIMALLILNLLIATMTAAYDQNYEKQYKSVNIFQLQDCLKLWQKYDPKGTAVIPYKKFWRLSSQIGILFGISKKKLIKSKQKFLQELDIEICQSSCPEQTSVLCYKFHDVIMKFSKIKLQVSKSQCSQQSSELTDFQIHPMIQTEISDYLTPTPHLYEHYRPYKNFKSGQMKYFFGLLRKLRAWRLVAKKKDSSVISKLSQIIKVALEKRHKQQLEMGQIRTHFLGPN